MMAWKRELTALITIPTKFDTEVIAYDGFVRFQQI